jgi:hypothetical protein
METLRRTISFRIARMTGQTLGNYKVVRKLGEGGGFGDADWARRDPALALLHGEPEFDRLYPATS